MAKPNEETDDDDESKPKQRSSEPMMTKRGLKPWPRSDRSVIWLLRSTCTHYCSVVIWALSVRWCNGVNLKDRVPDVKLLC